MGVLSAGVAELGQLVSYPFDANKRIYIGYLLGAVLLALPVYWHAANSSVQTDSTGQTNSTDKPRPAKSFKGLLGFLFPKHIYLAKSARHDYWLLVFNKLIKAAIFAPLIVTMVPIALSVSDGLEWLFGVIEPVSNNAVLVMAIFTVLLFLLDDFSRYLLHLALHKIPFLWPIHAVHHSASVLTPFTIYRSHPIESYFYACRMALAQGTAVGIGYYLFGPNLKMYDVLGANVFVFLFNVFGSNLRHSHIWLSWGDRLEGWLISPAQHQIHHSKALAHRDKNLGSALAIWDRAFGSLVWASEVPSKQLDIGVSYKVGHDSLTGIYINPFKQSFAVITATLKRYAARLKQRSHS
ncbi:sterol desaturase family protein [Shewanella maritima]|uniref:Sterol desaturase family protein n=1 Tax=Shewanella maritima TaxID=2520507 RepID=A0A411PMR5_9GAMM|nr:sterol desaturase family protein [Shewanella maritima]QBF84830.1 sterol desaturase family protein [Shewanella maritima]